MLQLQLMDQCTPGVCVLLYICTCDLKGVVVDLCTAGENVVTGGGGVAKGFCSEDDDLAGL